METSKTDSNKASKAVRSVPIGLVLSIIAALLWMAIRDRPTPAPIQPAHADNNVQDHAPGAVSLVVERMAYHGDSGMNPLFDIHYIDILNRSTDPITINAVILNGEWWACRANPAQFFYPNAKDWPVTLTIGDRAQAYHVAGRGMPLFQCAYGKDVIFIDLFTARGHYRWEGVAVVRIDDSTSPPDSIARRYPVEVKKD